MILELNEVIDRLVELDREDLTELEIAEKAYLILLRYELIEQLR